MKVGYPLKFGETDYSGDCMDVIKIVNPDNQIMLGFGDSYLLSCVYVSICRHVFVGEHSLHLSCHNAIFLLFCLH